MTLSKYILNQKFSIHEFMDYQESHRLTLFFFFMIMSRT